MTVRTFQSYKFSLDDHPVLQQKLIELGKYLSTEGKTDGELTVLPVNDPILEDLVVMRSWSSEEAAQEWADKWLKVVKEYANTKEGYLLTDNSYAIEIKTV